MKFGAWLSTGLKLLLRSLTLSNLFSYLSSLSKGNVRDCSNKFNQNCDKVINQGSSRLTSLLSTLQDYCGAYACASSISSIVLGVLLGFLGTLLAIFAGEEYFLFGAFLELLTLLPIVFSVAVALLIPFLIVYVLEGHKTKPFSVSSLKVYYFILMIFAGLSLLSNIISPLLSTCGDIISLLFNDFSIFAFLLSIIDVLFTVYFGAVVLDILSGALTSIENYVLSLSDYELTSNNIHSNVVDAWGEGPNLSKDYIEFNKDSNTQTNWENSQTPIDWDKDNNNLN